MRRVTAIACVLMVPALFAAAQGHTLDSVEGYRMEIGWENEPPYTGEINAIILYVSPLVPGLELENQPFENGVVGLEDTLKMQLVSKDSRITLFLDPDKEIPGKYRAFVKILKPGYYQANILGNIDDTTISFSMHPPSVRNADHIAFPQEYGPIHDIAVGQDVIRADLENLTSKYRADLDDLASAYQAELEGLRERVGALERAEGSNGIAYAGLGLGAVGIGLAAVALYRSRVAS